MKVISDTVNEEAEMQGNLFGGLARKPVVALKAFQEGLKGRSNDNPYSRVDPYYINDYNKDVLAHIGRKLMNPLPDSEMHYPKPLRSSFVIEGDPIDLSREAIMYKQHMDSVEALIDKSKEFLAEKQFPNALANINQALDIDPSNDVARSVFAEIIKEEERATFDQKREEQKQQEHLAEQQILSEQEQQEEMKKRQMIEEYAHKIDECLAKGDFAEAQRLAQIVRKIDAKDERVQELIDKIDLKLFKRSLDPRILHNDVFMEDVIHEHFKHYQEYADVGLQDMARRELQKISFLESLKDS